MAACPSLRRRRLDRQRRRRPAPDRPLEGLTLLEAAAVGGDELAVDAPRERARPGLQGRADPDRIAVAMSGGVDSAVALLRAGPKAIGVTLRLWIDPEAPDLDRACCSPRPSRRAAYLPLARHPARHARCSRRLPARHRRAVRPRLRARRDTQPLHQLQRVLPLRAAARLREQAGAGRLATGHLRADRPAAGGCCWRARRTGRRTSRTCSRASIPASSTGSGSRSASRRRTRRAPRRLARGSVAGRTESQEACFLGGADYRAFLERRGLPPTPGRSWTSTVRWSAPIRASGGSPGQRKGLGVAMVPCRTPSRPSRKAIASSSGRASPRAPNGSRGGQAPRRRRSGRRQAALPLPAVPGNVEALSRGFRVVLDEPVYGAATGQAAVLSRGRRGRRRAGNVLPPLSAHPAIHAGFWPAITRCQSLLLRLTKVDSGSLSVCSASGEPAVCVRPAPSARDPETRRHYLKGTRPYRHGSQAR